MSVAVVCRLLAGVATSPLLQSWFAATRDRRAGDPYFSTRRQRRQPARRS